MISTWLATFAVHSTIWCGIAWLWLRLRPRTVARVREAVWFTAIAASVIAPTVHAMSSGSMALWRMSLPTQTAAVRGAALRDFAEVAWLIVATLLVLAYAMRLERFRRRLQGRRRVIDPRATRMLAALTRRAALAEPLALTESTRVGSPVAIGFGRRREVCIPPRARTELDDDELRALLGHEVAHHMRRDTVRLAVLNLLNAVFFFQPLFRIALHDAHRAAEEQCDDWASEQLVDRLAMASCLTEVAGWLVQCDRRIPVPCIGRRRSHLEVRVRRLLAGRSASRTPSRARLCVGAFGLIVLATWSAPVLSTSFDDTEREHGRRRGAPEHRDAREHERRDAREHAHHR